ncbi:MAG: CAP domain-containing protein [Bacillus sp. (in: Bacteria)]|nr:CAP domain-containing protein [Bacillus sp. (in: firmicutes)]
MRIIFMLILCVTLFIIFMTSEYVDRTFNGVNDEGDTSSYQEIVEYQVDSNSDEKTEEQRLDEEQEVVVTSIHEWIGKKEVDLVQIYGDPNRRDLTQYDYEWYVYDRGDERIQFAISLVDRKIVSVFTNSQSEEIANVIIGDLYEHVYEYYSFTDTVSLTGNRSSYQFELKEEELKMYPLAQIDDVWVKFYFDVVENSLSSVRFLDQETLLLLRPYSIVYRGELPMIRELTEEEWDEVQEGQARQIFDLTNDIRKSHGLPPVKWHDGTGQVAFLHSKDMYENDYFSHTSPNHGELKDRLQGEQVSFQRAAENIAAHYVDGIAAVVGWLNSEGHRVNLLNEEFTHLGVGVYRSYYTQNFMTPW